jgi:transcriptional regulator with XRE-family HTH domain
VDVGDRIRILRERKGLSQKHLAYKLGIPNQSLSNYERGFREAPAEVLRKIADFFGVSVDYLLGRESIVYDRNSPKDLKELLEHGTFLYDNVTLDDQDIEQIRRMLEYIVDYKKKAMEAEKKLSD